MRHQVAEQRRHGDWGQTVWRIAADDQLEAVEGAGERRAERAGNSARGSTADQDAQIGTSQLECPADTRGDAAGQLGVARFDADRSTYPARPNGLHGNDNAAEKGHAAAVQRVRLNRIDLSLRPPAHDQLAGNAEDDAAGERDRNCHHRIEPQQSRQPHAGLEAKQDLVQQVDAGAHRRHDQTGNRSSQRRQRDQTGFPRPHECAQTPWYFQSAGQPIDQDGVTIVIAAPESRYKGTVPSGLVHTADLPGA